MSDPQEPPLDEIQWRSPELAQFIGGVHTNTILPYFAESPFFDKTSNNAALLNQARFNQDMVQFVATREAFEARLSSMQGLEFVVSSEAKTVASSAVAGLMLANDSAWVIRKQMRRKRPGREDDVTVLASYFVVGENIYMAPTAANVIGSRMLSAVDSLTKFLSTASSLPIFSPSLGHIYIPPTPKHPSTGSSLNSMLASQTTQNTSAANTPMPSQESSSLGRPGTGHKTLRESGQDLSDLRTLADALNLATAYQTEYVDENAIVGEPGSFILASSHAHSQSQTQAGVTAASGASQQGSSSQITTKRGSASGPSGKKASAPPTPKISTAGTQRKGSRSGEKGQASPATATGTIPPKPKRKKSKVAANSGSPS